MKSTEATSADVSFSTRLLGFDRREVRAFIANLLDDYERIRAELDLERRSAESQAAAPPLPAPEATTREMQRILTGAHRVADEIEQRAAEEGARAVAEMQARAVDILKDAEQRAVAITEAARREVSRLEERAASLRSHCLRLRSAFETAADTAGAGLTEIASIETGDARPAASVATT